MARKPPLRKTSVQRGERSNEKLVVLPKPTVLCLRIAAPAPPRFASLSKHRPRTISGTLKNRRPENQTTKNQQSIETKRVIWCARTDSNGRPSGSKPLRA